MLRASLIPRTLALATLLLGVLTLAACSPVLQSQPPTAAPVATSAAKPSQGSTASAANATSAAPKPTASPAASPATRPAAANGSNTSAPAASGSSASGSSAKPSPAPSPTAQAAARPTNGNGGARAGASPPAVVATAVAGLPAVGPSPAVSAESRGPSAPPDALGVAASANAAASANTTDAEAVALCGPGAVLSTRAGQAAGRSATVAVKRVEASYQPATRGQPTFLNDAPYPNHVFTAVIWGEHRAQFQPAPESWQGKALCVTGPVTLFQQRPQVVVSSPSQLRAAR